jgi:hypothetical protein
VVGLCALAALRTAFFCAAFPFFGNVDEPGHFDLVVKYARGHVPSGFERWDLDSARLIVLESTPEYFETPDGYPDGAYPPPNRLATPEDRNKFESQMAVVLSSENHESTQPPLYYFVAACWYRVGKSLGLGGRHVLYWLRFLDVVLIGLLTWLAYVTARTVFPDRAFLRLGVPLLIAFFPQDSMYLVNNDVLLPLTGGAAFLCLLLLCRGPSRGYAFHAATGLLVAASILVKFSSVALLPVGAGMIGWSVWRWRRTPGLSVELAKGVVALAAAFLPVAAWATRNYFVLGDVTGSAIKARYLGWTLKPIAAWPSHPIFGARGLLIFLRETMATFWRGELVWALKPIASPGWDGFYVVSTTVFLAAAVIAPWTWRKDDRASDRWVLGPSLLLFTLSFAFLAAISVIYDFGACYYPSRAMPYMTSGRLATGALIPFAILYLSGLDALLPRTLAPRVRWAILTFPIALMTVSEIVMSRPAFHSAYNGFHIN